MMSNPYSVLMLPKNYQEISLKNLEDTMRVFWRESKDIYSEETYQKFMKKVENEPGESKKKERLFNRLVFVKYYYLKTHKGDTRNELKNAYHTIKNEKRRRVYETSKTHTFTNGVRTIDMLYRTQERMKKSVDPENYFKEYTGAPYRWDFSETRNPDACLLNDVNRRKQRVIAIQLGRFLYETWMQAPTEDHPEGKATFQDAATIIGVSKLDNRGNIIKNDVVIARLNSEDNKCNRAFFRDVFLSDERIDGANLKNNGFIGSILKSTDGDQMIEYNHIADSELVTALEFAKYEGLARSEKKVTFTEVKEKFRKMQEYYVKSILEQEKKVENKGEEAWAK